MGFDGHVVSDCGAVGDIHAGHKVVQTGEEAAAVAVKNGCDLNCGGTYPLLVASVAAGLVTEDDIDRAVRHVFATRFRLGMFDPPERVPYASVPFEVNDCEEHRAVALRMARESIVLLRNEGGLLPLSKNTKRLAVVGPNADDAELLKGNYCGEPSRSVTPLAGIRKAVPGAEVVHMPGCSLKGRETDGFAQAVAAAAKADVVVAVMGFAPRLEGEEGEVAEEDGGGDRLRMGLPGVQEDLLRELCATGKPVVLALTNGSAVAINWADENVPAILDIWYGGEECGTALAEVLFGDYSPAGRLPLTFYRSLDQVPEFTDYRMEGRTYRYMKREPLYRFGYGLSYTRFAYSGLVLDPAEVAAGDPVEVSAEVENVGTRPGDEVVQLYVTNLDATVPVPVRQLAGFRRLGLAPGEKRRVSFTLQPAQMSVIDEEWKRTVRAGRFALAVGGGQPGDPKASERAGSNVLEAELRVTGRAVELEK